MSKFSVSYKYELIDKYTRVANRIKRSTDGMKKGFDKTGKSVGKFRRGLVKSVKEMVKSKLAIASVAASITLLGRSVITTFLGFEKSMNRVSAVTMGTEDQLKSMGALAKKLGSTTAFTASQSADALVYLSQAGLSVDEAMAALPNALQLAAAGNMDLASAADISTNVLAQMGMEVSELARVNDVLSRAQSISNTDVLQLAEAMRPVGATAKNLGLDIEQLSSALGVMANNGEKGSIAGTLLRNMLTNMAAPSSKQLKIYQGLGVNIRDYTDEMGRIKNMKGFIGALEELNVNGKLSVDHLEKLFGERGFRAAQLLIGSGADAFGDFNKQLLNAGGTAKEMADRQMAGLTGATLRLKSAWEGFKIEILDNSLFGNLIAGVVNATASMFNFLTPSGELAKSMGEVTRATLKAVEPFTVLFKILGSGAFFIVDLSIKRAVIGLKAFASGVLFVIRLLETMGAVAFAIATLNFSSIGEIIKNSFSEGADEMNGIWGKNPAAEGAAAKKGQDGKNGEITVRTDAGTSITQSSGVNLGLGATVASSGM